MVGKVNSIVCKPVSGRVILFNPITKVVAGCFVLISFALAEENVLKIGDEVPVFKLPYATQEKVDFDGILVDKKPCKI